jgi:predicted metal-binding membrane protein
MAIYRVLAASGLVRPVRIRGFCPACRVGATATVGNEVPARAVLALVVLAVAAAAWVVAIAHARSMSGAMGLGPLPSFAAAWIVMMVAMMLPSATPLVLGFARSNERRRYWPAATGLLMVSYLAIWFAFGVTGFALYNLLRMPWPQQGLLGGALLALAGAYALTPWKRAGEARCRELCVLHGPLPFNLFQSAMVAGARYGVSCLGCTGALMGAMVVIGMTSAAWMALIAAFVLLYKLTPAPSLSRTVSLAAVLAALGAVYALTIP